MHNDPPAGDVWAEGGAPCREIERDYGIPRTRQFEEFAKDPPGLTSVLIGRRRIVARASARAYLARLHREQNGDGA